MNHIHDSQEGEHNREQLIEFLFEEAWLLDQQKFHDWLELVAEDIEYRAPVRATRERGAGQSEFSEKAFIFKEDYDSLDARVRRFDTEYAWSENPPTRTQRNINNVRIGETRKDEIDIRDNIMLVRSREDQAEPNVMTGQRRSTLRVTTEGLKLSKRDVYLNQTVLEKPPLSFLI